MVYPLDKSRHKLTCHGVQVGSDGLKLPNCALDAEPLIMDRIPVTLINIPMTLYSSLVVIIRSIMIESCKSCISNSRHFILTLIAVQVNLT